MVGLRLRLTALVLGAIVVAFGLLFGGINVGLRGDVDRLANQSVDAGSDAVNAALQARTEQVRSTVLQAAGLASLASALHGGERSALLTAASDTAQAGNLSFVAILDSHGTVLASSRGGHGSIGKSAMLQDALAQTAGGMALLSVAELKTFGIDAKTPQLVSFAATPVNEAGRSIGVVFGGQLVDSTLKAVDDVSRFTGGQAAVVVGGSAVASSLADKDGGKVVGFTVPNATGAGDAPPAFTGIQNVEGTQYFVKIAPLSGYNGKLVGAYWFGVPYANFQAIINHTLGQIALWGSIGGVIALILGIVVADRIGRQIARRSREVNESASELKVLVVGGEVSGDHVDQTREKLVELKELAAKNGTDDGRLEELASQAVDDVIVIDALSTELSGRMRDAAIRVERLSNVARELDQLVAGARVSKN